jgi:ketosteroid isomerase-like protein
MSQENVEVVKGIYQSTGRRDWEAVMAKYSPDVELDSSVFPGGGVYTGLDGIREWFRQWFGAWEEYRDDMEAARAYADPEVEVYVAQEADLPVGLDEVYHGPDGYCRAMEEWAEAWRDWRVEVEDRD